jgi:hypothetical protein
MIMVGNLYGSHLQTWLFSGKRWQELHPKVSPPDGLVFLSYDAATGDIILLSVDTANAVWVFNGEGWVRGPPMPNSSTFFPLATVYDPALRSVLAIGRSGSGDGVFATLILTKTAWEPLDTNGVLPAIGPWVLQLAVAFDQRLNEVVLYYGTPALNPAVPLENQTWVLRDKDWVELRTAANPSVRRLPSLSCWDAKGDVVLFGGASATKFDNDLWSFTGTGWVPVSYTAAAA